MKALHIGIVLVLCSCLSGRTYLNAHLDPHDATVKKIVLRGSSASEVYHDHLIIAATGSEFVIKGECTDIVIRGLHLVSEGPDVYKGITPSELTYTVHYYAYRGRIYIQLSPVPKSFLGEDHLFQDEILYIITTDPGHGL